MLQKPRPICKALFPDVDLVSHTSRFVSPRVPPAMLYKNHLVRTLRVKGRVLPLLISLNTTKY